MSTHPVKYLQDKVSKLQELLKYYDDSIQKCNNRTCHLNFKLNEFEATITKIDRHIIFGDILDIVKDYIKSYSALVTVQEAQRAQIMKEINETVTMIKDIENQEPDIAEADIISNLVED